MTIDDGGPATILTVDGVRVLVSPHHVALLNANKWRIGSNGYVYLCGGRTSGRQCLMHRIVSRAWEHKKQVHHLNGNKLDNRDENLVLTDATEHQRKFHAEQLTIHNERQRRYPTTRACLGCGVAFVVPAAHRGRNRYCTKLCGNRNRRPLAAAIGEDA